jgi:hypothetical protein
MTATTTRPEVVANDDAPAFVLSAVPDQPDVTRVTDLAAIVAELKATNERTAKAEADLVALKETVRQWFIKFTKDSWDFANGKYGDDSLCATWERYCAEVGVPPRPEKSNPILVRGNVKMPLSAITIADTTRIPRAVAQKMIDSLPEEERFSVTQNSWNVTVGQFDLDDPTWEPLLRKRPNSCCCVAARADFANKVRANYGAKAFADMATLTIDCPALAHVPWEAPS